jgi:hypothetical protein
VVLLVAAFFLPVALYIMMPVMLPAALATGRSAGRSIAVQCCYVSTTPVAMVRLVKVKEPEGRNFSRQRVDLHDPVWRFRPDGVMMRMTSHRCS